MCMLINRICKEIKRWNKKTHHQQVFHRGALGQQLLQSTWDNALINNTGNVVDGKSTRHLPGSQRVRSAACTFTAPPRRCCIFATPLNGLAQPRKDDAHTYIVWHRDISSIFASLQLICGVLQQNEQQIFNYKNAVALAKANAPAFLMCISRNILVLLLEFEVFFSKNFKRFFFSKAFIQISRVKSCFLKSFPRPEQRVSMILSASTNRNFVPCAKNLEQQLLLQAPTHWVSLL